MKTNCNHTLSAISVSEGSEKFDIEGKRRNSSETIYRKTANVRCY